MKKEKQFIYFLETIGGKKFESGSVAPIHKARIVLFAVVVFQSCAAGISNALQENGELSGTAGVLVAVLMLAGGIVSVASRKSVKNGGNIALIVLFGLAALIGFTNYGSYSDLAIWSGWCVINAVLALVAIFVGKKKAKADTSASDAE